MKATLSLLAVLLLSTSLQAQSSLLKGLVNDISGVPLADVLIEAIGPDSSIVGKCVSDDKGRYAIDPLPPGSYMVRVSMEGFVEHRQMGVLISDRKITFMDINLTPIGWKAPKEPKKKKRKRRSKR
jgi:protocatechuate 3,4-dioxygenase beta subunit